MHLNRASFKQTLAAMYGTVVLLLSKCRFTERHFPELLVFTKSACHKFIHFRVVNESVIWYAPVFIWSTVFLRFTVLSKFGNTILGGNAPIPPYFDYLLFFLVQDPVTEEYSLSFLNCIIFWGNGSFGELTFGEITIGKTTFREK